MNYLITGTSGFIGFHLALKLLSLGHGVVGIDNENDYYSQQLKYDRRIKLEEFDNFKFLKIDISYNIEMLILLTNLNIKFDCIIHLAAQAGVRYSLENPKAYVNTNIIGFLNILELGRQLGIKKIIYASSSSVYGNSELNTKFSESSSNTNNPISLYAMTKKSNELLASTYEHLYNITCIGLRFFTVYGPLGRPDMAYFKFLNSLYKNEGIEIYNNGLSIRDFTYIDDIVCGIENCITYNGNVRIFNLGNSKPIQVNKFIQTLESITEKKFIKSYIGNQAGDVNSTFADTTLAKRELGREAKYSLSDGLSNFVNRYIEYYNFSSKAK